MCFVLCDQFPTHLFGHQDRYVLFLTFKLTAQKPFEDELKMFLLFFYNPDASLEGSSMGDLGLPGGLEPAGLPTVIHVSDVKAPRQNISAAVRRRRSILFPSGVKLCAQETAEQVVDHHLNFFHLRGEAEHSRGCRWNSSLLLGRGGPGTEYWGLLHVKMGKTGPRILLWCQNSG